jgi:hypothetical protein
VVVVEAATTTENVSHERGVERIEEDGLEEETGGVSLKKGVEIEHGWRREK